MRKHHTDDDGILHKVRVADYQNETFQMHNGQSGLVVAKCGSAKCPKYRVADAIGGRRR